MSDNSATVIRNGFKNIYNNPKKIRGYSAAEKKAIYKAGKDGSIVDLVKTFGSRLLPIGASLSDPATGVAVAGGAKIARNAAEASKVNQANAVKDAVLGNLAPVDNRMRTPPFALGTIYSKILEEE